LPDNFQVEFGDTEASHQTNEAAYWEEAVRLREKYASQIKIIIGFEIDWIRPASKELIDRSLSRFPFEFFIGSIHHMHTVPIDYDRPMYEQARDLAGGTDERLFEDYFDAQLDMLQQLQPLVVGHFDLIRLKSDDMERSFTSWPGVWSKVLRNLDFIASYGGMLELNSAALRKGMSEPYPKAEICQVSHLRTSSFYSDRSQEFGARGGRFCLSDDSHGVDQVALNFHRVLEFLSRADISTLHYLQLEPTVGSNVPDARFPCTQIAEISVEDLRKMAFWSSST
jgi:histidinol-phosphatase (PHP family)